MRIHILGICGSFMGAIALLAKQLGYEVTGSDENVYPPMSDTLQNAGITISQGYEPTHLQPVPDCILIGKTIKRGNLALEFVLNKGLPYCSGPQWLAEHVLAGRHVIAVSGTHGKTTTSSILAWILTAAELKPGFLIGGLPLNFSSNTSLGQSEYFVIEADEYGSAFCDMRSKFMHYHPRTLIINNLEFDHIDFFENLEAIKQQFQQLLATVPTAGSVIYPESDNEVQDVITRGCWAAQQTFGLQQGAWQAKNIAADGSEFELWHLDQKLGVVKWSMLGMHNVHNALAATVAAHEIGIPVDKIINALTTFKGVKRRLEIFGRVNGITIYDDFAHHPTAIAKTIAGLRARVNQQRIFAVLQFASHTMHSGFHRGKLAPALEKADQILLLQPDKNNSFAQSVAQELGASAHVFNNVNDIINYLTPELHTDDHVLIMSSKGFDGIHQRLIKQLQRDH